MKTSFGPIKPRAAVWATRAVAGRSRLSWSDAVHPSRLATASSAERWIRKAVDERGLGPPGLVGLADQGTAQIAVEISFKGFWAVSLALKVVFSDLRPAQG